MKWSELLNFKCPYIGCGFNLTTKKSSDIKNNIYACEKCAFYISSIRFNEIIQNILHPKKFPMPDPPDFIKELRNKSVDNPVNIDV